MTVAYDALLGSSTPAFVALAEVQPAEVLGVFTRAGLGLLPVLETSTTGTALSAGLGTVQNGGFGNEILVVRAQADVAVSGLTVTATIGGLPYALTLGASRSSVGIWYLVAPVAGTITLTFSGGGVANVAWWAGVYKNVNQTAPFGTAATTAGAANPISASPTGATTDLVIDAVAYGDVSPTTATGTGHVKDATVVYLGLTHFIVGSSPGTGAANAQSYTSGSSSFTNLVTVPLVGDGIAYSLQFKSVVATDVVAGGFYRRLDSVRQNATALTLRASAALVSANPGSYYLDTATDTLYVSTTTGVSPNDVALMGAWFSLFFASRSVSFTDQPLYEPRVADSLPTLVSEKPDPLFGATIADNGQLVLHNADKLFDKLSRSWVWRNKKVTLKLGGIGLAYSDFATVGTMRINTVQVDDVQCVLTLETLGTVLNQNLCRNTWAGGSNPIGSGVTTAASGDTTGLFQPAVFGRALDCPVPLVNTSGAHLVFGTCDPAINTSGVTVNAVYAINRTTKVRTTLTNTTDYTFTAFAITLLADATYADATYEIRADLIDVLAGFAQGTRFGTFTKLLLTRLGEDLANIDTAAVASADTAAPQDLGLWLTDGSISGASILERLCRCVGFSGGQVYLTTSGKWAPRVWDPTMPAAFTLNDNDFSGWKATSDLTAVISEARVLYAKQNATGGSTQSSASNSTVRYSQESTDSVVIDSLLLDADTAAALAEHVRFLRGTTPNLIEFEERGCLLMTASIGDLVAVTRARAPIARTGRADGQYFMIQKLEKMPASATGAPIVRGILNDMEGQTDRIARYSDSPTTLTWATATAAEKAVYGFYADANRYIDPADPLTRDAKVYF